MLTNFGEEWETKILYGGLSKATSIEIGLFYDATDTLGDTDDLAAITTEPAGSFYERQTLTIGTDFTPADFSGNYGTRIADKLFDISDSSQDIDSYFLVASFQADGESSANDHLIAVGTLDQTYDLSQITEFKVSDARITRN